MSRAARRIWRTDALDDAAPGAGTGLAEELSTTGGGVLFKGSGFYETDYRSDSYKAGEKAAKKDSSSSDSSSSSD